MSDVETKIEVEAEEFAEELFDEALDREGAGAVRVRASFGGCYCACGN